MAIQDHRKIYVTGDHLYENELKCISALKPCYARVSSEEVA
jgi:hypothetical protein